MGQRSKSERQSRYHTSPSTTCNSPALSARLSSAGDAEHSAEGPIELSVTAKPGSYSPYFPEDHYLVGLEDGGLWGKDPLFRWVRAGGKSSRDLWRVEPWTGCVMPGKLPFVAHRNTCGGLSGMTCMSE